MSAITASLAGGWSRLRPGLSYRPCGIQLRDMNCRFLKETKKMFADPQLFRNETSNQRMKFI